MTGPARCFGLSKSKIAMFEQCPKRFWLSVHRPGLAERDDRAEARFAAGHEVGAIARALLPEGVLVEPRPDLSAALAMTRALLDAAHDGPIFEATLEHDGVLVRVDVLEPDGDGWRMAEVKSSTKVKEYHLGDLATQLWVAREAGLPVTGAVIRHVDNAFVLEREDAYPSLFADADVMVEVEPIAAGRGEVVASARATLGGPEPATAPGAHCDAPFPCDFAGHCRAALPPGPEWPVTILPYGGGRRWIERGVDDLFAVDPGQVDTPIHRRVHRATVSGEVFHDVDGARAAMSAWAYPRTWLDFETIGFAAPRWIGTRPYQQVPFQFSAHVEAEDGGIEHLEFLSLDGADPRRACAEALVAAVPARGAVIGYHAAFERARILELAAALPDLADALGGIADRIVDLLPVARATWYHRDQRGSWSIKAVLPTVAPELDYSGLEVGDGSAAQAAYLEAVALGAGASRRAGIDVALRAYCRRDTEAMMVLARRLCGSGSTP